MNPKYSLILLLFFVMSAGAQAVGPDEKLGLHSDGGPWRFYPAQTVDKKLPNVLLIGDSIMNGYRGRVIQLLKGHANVDCWLTPVHLKSKNLYEDLRKVVSYRNYDVIHFNIGLHGWPKGRILTSEYPQLLKDYVTVLKKNAPKAQLVWGTITQVHQKGGAQLDQEINPTIVARNKMAKQVMKEENISVNDLYELMSDKLNLVRGDRFHWKGAAYEMMAKQTVQSINSHL